MTIKTQPVTINGVKYYVKIDDTKTGSDKIVSVFNANSQSVNRV